jgi:hypothetical protein
MMRSRKEVKESARIDDAERSQENNDIHEEHQRKKSRTNERIDKKIKMKMDMKINIKDRRREEEY